VEQKEMSEERATRRDQRKNEREDRRTKLSEEL
jgi:hypothetical protein